MPILLGRSIRQSIEKCLLKKWQKLQKLFILFIYFHQKQPISIMLFFTGVSKGRKNLWSDLYIYLDQFFALHFELRLCSDFFYLWWNCCPKFRSLVEKGCSTCGEFKINSTTSSVSRSYTCITQVTVSNLKEPVEMIKGLF